MPLSSGDAQIMIHIKLEGVEDVARKLSAQELSKVTTRAIRDATKYGKTEASSLIRSKWAIRKKDLDPRITSKSWVDQGEIAIGGKTIGLSYFSPQVKTGGVKYSRSKDGGISGRKSGGKNTALSVKLLRSGARTQLPTGWLDYTRDFAGRAKGGAFLLGENQSYRVLSRFGGKVVGPRSISIASMLSGSNQDGKLDRLKAAISERLRTRWLHHASRVLPR